MELSAAKKEVEVAAENKINSNEVLLGGKHHGLLFSDRLMDRVAAGGGAVNLTWLLDSLLIKQKRIDFMDALLLYCRLLPSQSIKKINSIMGFSVVLKAIGVGHPNREIAALMPIIYTANWKFGHAAYLSI